MAHSACAFSCLTTECTGCWPTIVLRKLRLNWLFRRFSFRATPPLPSQGPGIPLPGYKPGAERNLLSAVDEATRCVRMTGEGHYVLLAGGDLCLCFGADLPDIVYCPGSVLGSDNGACQQEDFTPPFRVKTPRAVKTDRRQMTTLTSDILNFCLSFCSQKE